MNRKPFCPNRYRSGLLALAALAALAGCGVDGPPERPRERPEPAPASSITLSGNASAGVVGNR